MSTEYHLYQPYAAPTIQIDDEARARAADFLREAHRSGRLDAAELRRRLDLAERAVDRGQLNVAMLGLAPQRAGATITPAPSAPAPATRPAGPLTNPVSMAVHLSALPTLMLGPAVAHLLSPRGSVVRREAAKAFNAQLSWLILTTTVALVSVPVMHHTHLVPLVLALATVLWGVSTVSLALGAGRGEDRRPTVSRVLPVRVLEP